MGDALEPLPESAPEADRARRLAAIETLSQVRTMTGYKLATCPRWYTAQPRVLRAAAVWFEREKGCVNEPMTCRLVAEIREIDKGIAAESAYTRKLDKQKKK